MASLTISAVDDSLHRHLVPICLSTERWPYLENATDFLFFGRWQASLNTDLISFNLFHIQQSRNEITFHWVERSHDLILVYSSCKMRLYIDRMLWSRMRRLNETVSSPYQELSGGTQGTQLIFRGKSSPPSLWTSYLLNSIKYRFCSNTPLSFNWTWYLNESKD